MKKAAKEKTGVPDPHVFSFRLPDECLEWLDSNLPGIHDNRHQALRGFVIQTIQANPTYIPAAHDPMERLRQEMRELIEAQADHAKEELRKFVRKMLEDSGTFNRIQQVREMGDGEMGDEITDDLINNLLEGVR